MRLQIMETSNNSKVSNVSNESNETILSNESKESKESKESNKTILSNESKVSNESNETISSKTLLLLDSLMEYYRKNINILSSIITQKSTLSLRILDWLVTNYAKKNNIVYSIYNKTGSSINFNVYLEYKNQLKAYSKKYFDPFCRRDRILINTKTLIWSIYKDPKQKCNNNNEIITTVGQLNFFKWLIENNVLNYAIENIIAIDKDMSDTLKINKTNEKKRKELSKNASKAICSYEGNVIIIFN